MSPHDVANIARRIDLKVERAKKHIIDLEIAWRAFIKTNPYPIAFKDDFDAGERSYYIRSIGDMPSIIPLTVGDTLQNLRSALDHLAYHLALVGGVSNKALDSIYFPIFETAAKYNAGKTGKIKGLRQDAIDAIDIVEPYGGGRGSILWTVHTLNNIDKHKLLVTAIADLTAHSISPSQAAKAGFPHPVPADHLPNVMVGVAKKTFPLKAGDTLVSIPHTEMQKQMKFMMVPAFGEPRIVEGRPIMPTLHEMIQFVRILIAQFADKGLYV